MISLGHGLDGLKGSFFGDVGDLEVAGLEGLRGERSAARVWLAEGMPRLLYDSDDFCDGELGKAAGAAGAAGSAGFLSSEGNFAGEVVTSSAASRHSSLT